MNDISTFIFDVDGVLTDSSVFVTNEEKFFVLWIFEMVMPWKPAVESGYNVCIISGGSNEGVRIRLRNLGITDIHLGTPNKVETFKEYTDLHD
jgi:3-deoxy-D-manno-octulosonate 8-phosphate phosphatase (KDO 8-P phosphatase)